MRYGSLIVIQKQNTKVCKISSDEERDNNKTKGQNALVSIFSLLSLF
jgi:hypothetical protein